VCHAVNSHNPHGMAAKAKAFQTQNATPHQQYDHIKLKELPDRQRVHGPHSAGYTPCKQVSTTPRK